MSDNEGRSFVESSLTSLSGDRPTGCLAVRTADGLTASVYLKEGRIYAVEVPGPRPVLGTRLVTLGAASSKDVFDALDRQWAELGKWALGALLVEMGYAEREAVEPGVREYLLDGLADLLGWDSVSCDFRPDLTTREDLVEPLEVDAALAEAKARSTEWSDHVAALGQPDPVVALVGEPGAGPDEIARAVTTNLLVERPLSELAEICGFSLLEVARAVRALVESSVVTVVVSTEPEAADEPERDVAAQTAPNPNGSPSTARSTRSPGPAPGPKAAEGRTKKAEPSAADKGNSPA